MTQVTAEVPPVEPPWYRQFWPWVLMLLPLAAVVGGLATLAIAIIHREPYPVIRDAARPGVVVEQGVRGGAGVPDRTADVTAGSSD